MIYQYYRSEQDFLEEWFGRGPGDGDFWGYPGDEQTQ